MQEWVIICYSLLANSIRAQQIYGDKVIKSGRVIFVMTAEMTWQVLNEAGTDGKQ